MVKNKEQFDIVAEKLADDSGIRVSESFSFHDVDEKTKSYKDFYEKASKEIIAKSKNIFVPTDLNISYSIPQIVYTMRELFKNKKFRNQFAKNDDLNWSLGLCALSSVCLYELGGKDKVFNLMAISPKDWSQGPLIYLQDIKNMQPFHTTDGQVFIGDIPYDLGFVLDADRFKTANQDDFINLVKRNLDRNS